MPANKKNICLPTCRKYINASEKSDVMVFLWCIINTVSSNEYLEPSALTIRVLQVPVVRFYKASPSKPAAFIPLMHPPHNLFTPSSSPIMKDFGMRRWVCFDHTLFAAPTRTPTPPPRRSRCSPGSTTWPTRSCWIWSPCWRASARRRTFTVSCRAWGTGSRPDLLRLRPLVPWAQLPSSSWP